MSSTTTKMLRRRDTTYGGPISAFTAYHAGLNRLSAAEGKLTLDKISPDDGDAYYLVKDLGAIRNSANEPLSAIWTETSSRVKWKQLVSIDAALLYFIHPDDVDEDIIISVACKTMAPAYVSQLGDFCWGRESFAKIIGNNTAFHNQTLTTPEAYLNYIKHSTGIIFSDILEKWCNNAGDYKEQILSAICARTKNLYFVPVSTLNILKMFKSFDSSHYILIKMIIDRMGSECIPHVLRIIHPVNIRTGFISQLLIEDAISFSQLPQDLQVRDTVVLLPDKIGPAKFRELLDMITSRYDASA
ncbi:hypothetical protein KDA11_04720 [Candidatus Saccharibacteria bacterium]|nr:hypothetical protein [Candidatus Saccharibacteria bacterium]